jgi:DNA gyrase/topoisomerase IV subunit A
MSIKETKQPDAAKRKVVYEVGDDQNVSEESSGKFVDEKMFEFGRYTIEDRAVPDFRDGHKPVHRRLIYSLYGMQPSPNGTFMKCTRPVSDSMGKYHPHGSSFMSLVEMTWERYPLINGQGNFGSLLGDPPAADRYVECRVSKLVKHHFSCIDVAAMVPTYSGEFNEPIVINTRLPLLLMNGAMGIATGATTKIPSHNLGEICNAFEYVVRNWKTATTEGMLEFIKGPDFLFGGVLTSSKSEIVNLYKTGVGPLTFTCDYKIEPHPKNQSITNIIVSGFPDAFNTATFIGKTIPKLTEERVVVDFDEQYNKKTRELRFIISVDNAAALKKVLSELSCSVSYRFNITKRGNGEDDGASTEFESTNLLKLAKDWLLWRKDEEVKMLQLELKKLKAAKFLEDCKLLGMMNIQILADAVQQVKADPHAYLVSKLKINQEQAETLLKFRLIDLSKLNEKALREKIKGIEAEIGRVNIELQKPMAIVVKHLREVGKDTDARRTRIGARLHDERKMVQQGEARVFGVTTEGKLLGAIDERGSNSGNVIAVPSFEGIAVFGVSGSVGFFGPSEQGKAGVGFDKVVGAASREAKFLVAVGKDGYVLKTEHNRDSNKSIPCFLKGVETIAGFGAWDGDTLIAWGENGESKSVKLASIKEVRKNTKGVKVFSFEPVRALIVRKGQKLFTLDGNSLSVSSADGIGDTTPIVIGSQRNICFYAGGRRKFMDGASVRSALRKGEIKAAFDATLFSEVQDAGQ